ncbi:mitotic deacetylase associated SANT domain protein a [Hoplias malabaricus]|uniref:mitotic deacetylase associated SANT domain protein a n=1 Tax=Hoplias malabaricus TaxID=27720 RepID=UPI003462FFB0
MSLSPHQRGNIGNIPKQNVEAIEDAAQHSGDVFYNVGGPSLEQSHSRAGGRVDPNLDIQGSAVFKPDKAYQVWGHFQQSGSVKWVSQEPVQTSTWFQGIPNPTKLTQNFGPPLSGIDDARAHQTLHKTNHDVEALQQEKMAVGSSVPFSEPSQALAPGMEWDHHTMAAMQHAQFQVLQQGHKPGDPQFQTHAMHRNMPDSTLQPFQMAFGPTKQQQSSGFFQAFPGNSTSQNLTYSEQPKSQQQLLHLQQQQMQHQHQMQQLQQMHQMQQQQQRLHQIQQRYHHQQKLQEHLQQMQHQQKLQQQMQNLQQTETFPSQVHQQDQKPGSAQKQEENQIKSDSSASSAVQAQTQDPHPHSPVGQDSGTAKAPLEPQEPQTKHEVLPRRSRRLSKDGLSPLSSQPPKEPARNGGMGGQGPSGGVIQTTQRRRRASKEINLETLAQKASEMEFLPAKCDESSSGRQAGMLPLVIPVSVPVQRSQSGGQPEQVENWGQKQRPSAESIQQHHQYERKPSVIVARRRSLRNSASDSLNQDEGKDDGKSDKIKRRPRPEPLVIPPPKPCTFIAPSVYSSISAYQSHLRSPVRMMDHPLTLPPYTPPPILSPVREGSGLYFSTFLSSIAAGSQVLPPVPTPKTATRSLLHSSSSDITPPVLTLRGEATPVSVEPRINIGSQYQAEIPELQDQALALQDQHKAVQVWEPLPEAESSQKERVESLMVMACSSVLNGGGTNVELMHHCLYENKGDILKTLEMLMMKHPVFSRDHHLANYHYAGSDCWTVDEKHFFNKGISAYRKDFFLVQKLVRSKTVAQCVEFYYTYKKQVKVARNGTLTFGPTDPEERVPEVTPKQEQLEEPVDNKQTVTTEEPENVRSDQLMARTFQFKEDMDKVLVLSLPKISSVGELTALRQETRTPPPAPKPRPESKGRRAQPSAASKSQGEPEGIFPCKKCSRVFYKVKSRSAHMKSHAEQEKKAAAAAQRQREEEEAAARAKQKAAETERIRAEMEREGAGDAELEDSSEPEDEQDEDWA